MASRSRFYVDTPRDPSKRHSMFVSHSELAQKQDLSSNSSSATLPSAAGSVDRLTGLEEKKSPRFFTLKPKTSFSLKPFFTSSSSLVSLSPAKRRKAKERRDSYVQTEEFRPELGEVGVQTLNASTVDVPVQTCLEAWEEGDSYGQRRLAYASARTSPFWNRPYGGSSALSNSLISKNVLKDPLASPKLVKYAAPGDSQKTAFHRPSAVSPLDVNSCQSVSPPPQSCLPSSPASVPVKDFSVTGNFVSSTSHPESELAKKSSASSNVESYENVKPSLPHLDTNAKKSEQNLCQSENSVQVGETSLDNASKVSNESKNIIASHVEPLSVLKSESTDSPSRRPKSVHFDLPNSEPVKKQSYNKNEPRNVDKDFEALLKDLNVLTDNETDLQISFDVVEPVKCSTPSLLSPSLKSALDSLRQDFLAPIPESSPIPENEENDLPQENSESKSPDNNVKQIDSGTNPVQIVSVSPTALEPKKLFVRSVSEYENQNTNEVNKNDSGKPTPLEPKKLFARSVSEYENQNINEVNKNHSVKPTSQPIFTSANSGSNAETDSVEGNVYDNVIKEENPVKTVSLPILPSFFKPPSQSQTAEITEIGEYDKENNIESASDNQKQSYMPLETDFERNRLSRSSSRSSVRSNSKAGLDTIQESMNRFDSCENLDQLEEEIIRSLYSPDTEKLEESMMKNIELPPSESFQNSGTTATHMRRVILDQLLSGKSVEDIVPNYKMFQQPQPTIEKTGKYKLAKKYTAVLTKMEDDNCEKTSTEHNTPEIMPLTSLNFEWQQDVGGTNQREKRKTLHTKNNIPKAETPKKTSVFLFPEDNLSSANSSQNSTLEFSTTVQENRGSSVLEVRRSSWTPPHIVGSSNSSSPSSVNTVQNSPSSKEKSPDNKSGKCDFTNCLRPSKMQNSPFLAKLNTRSMSPCNFSHASPVQNSSPICNSPTTKKSGNSPKPPEAVGECDYASCLKPSQVQNSLFTAELSEITAGKSTNSLRDGSPLTVRINNSPLPTRSSSVDLPSATPIIEEKDISKQNNSFEPVSHKSEVSITLQTTAKLCNNEETKTETLQNKQPEITDYVTPEIKSSNQEVNEPSSLALEQEVPTSTVPPPPPPPPPSQVPKPVEFPKECNSGHTENKSVMVEQKSNVVALELSNEPKHVTVKTPVMAELEIKLQRQSKNDSLKRNLDDKDDELCPATSIEQDEIPDGKFIYFIFCLLNTILITK